MHESIIRTKFSGSIKTGMMAHFILERWLTYRRTVGSERHRIFITPSILAVTMLRLVRRALAGDRDLGLCLLVLGGYENIIGRIMKEESSFAALME